MTAFLGHHAHELGTLEATAIADARKLEVIFDRNRKWVYQAFTVAEIASSGVSMLSACGLHRAAMQLKRATTGAILTVPPGGRMGKILPTSGAWRGREESLPSWGKDSSHPSCQHGVGRLLPGLAHVNPN